MRFYQGFPPRATTRSAVSSHSCRVGSRGGGSRDPPPREPTSHVTASLCATRPDLRWATLLRYNTSGGNVEVSMSTKPMPLAQAISKFVNILPLEEKQARQQDLAKFLRWFGPDRRLSELNNPVFESRYAQLESSGADPGVEMYALKQFLTYLYNEKLIGGNLAKFIKVKRATRKTENGAPLPVQATRAPELVELSADGLAKMKEELEHLTKVVRAQVAQELYDARQDKDIRENAPYDAAKQHHALVEARIRALERLLATAAIIQVEQNGERI